MTQDDRMETITDPAVIRATDDPDERTTPARVGAAVALNLDAIEARQKAAASARWEIIGDRVGPRALMALLGEDVPALVAEVRGLTRLGQCDLDLLMRAEAAEAEVVTLRAQVKGLHEELLRGDPDVVTLRARLAAVVDEYPHADTCGSMLTPGAGYPCSCWQADLRAALAVTTGEGE